MFLDFTWNIKFRAFFITFATVTGSKRLDLVEDLLVKFAKNERDALKIRQVATDILFPLIAPTLDKKVWEINERGVSLRLSLNA